MEDFELGADATFGSDVSLTGGGVGVTFIRGENGDIGLGRANSYFVAMKFYKAVSRSTLKGVWSCEVNDLTTSLCKKNTTDSLANFNETSIIM
jgi:hypothetical protein